VDADVWARLAALEGTVVAYGTRHRVRVVAVTASGVYVRMGARPAVLLSRRTIEEALPHVAAGEPLPRPFRRLAPGLTAVLRAAGVGPGA
jgi:hypothetical protein